jgi:hypothetical protein
MSGEDKNALKEDKVGETPNTGKDGSKDPFEEVASSDCT